MEEAHEDLMKTMNRLSVEEQRKHVENVQTKVADVWGLTFFTYAYIYQRARLMQ